MRLYDALQRLQLGHGEMGEAGGGPAHAAGRGSLVQLGVMISAPRTDPRCFFCSAGTFSAVQNGQRAC